MIRGTLAAFLLTLLPLLVSCASGHRAPFTDPLQAIRTLGDVDARLDAAASASDRIKRADVGAVHYGEFSAPVWEVCFRPGTSAQYTILLTGGIHGNEPAGAETLVRFIETLGKNPDMYATFNIDVIPIVNPWGWAHDRRYDQQGIDINRDFASYRSQEAAIVRECVKGTRYSLIVDLHEDPSGQGFYLYQYANRDTTLSRGIIDAQRQQGRAIEQDVSMVILRTKDGLIDVPKWGLRYMRLTRQLSMTNYFRLKNSSNVYTVETPTRLPMEDRVQMHTLALDMLMDSLRVEK